jgi:hypothetical protein
MVFGNDPDRVAEIRQHLKAPAREFQPLLYRLIGVCNPADCQDLRPPTGRGKLASKKLWGVFLYQDPGFEVEAGGEAEIFVGGTSVAVDAPMLASPVRIETGFESDVGTVVSADDSPGGILEQNRAGSVIVLILRLV